MFGLTDWTRNGSLAEYTAVEARTLAALAVHIDHTVAAALPVSGLTAWQGLFDHARLTTGQAALIHGAAGSVGSIAVQLAREVGAAPRRHPRHYRHATHGAPHGRALRLPRG